MAAATFLVASVLRLVEGRGDPVTVVFAVGWAVLLGASVRRLRGSRPADPPGPRGR